MGDLFVAAERTHDHRLCRKRVATLFRLQTRRLAYAGSPEQAFDLAGERIRTARLYRPERVARQFAKSARLRGYDRQPRHHGLNTRRSEPFLTGRHDEDVDVAQRTDSIRNMAREAETIFQAHLRRQGLERTMQRPLTEYRKVDVRLARGDDG